MANTSLLTAPSPWQALDSQGVLRIPTTKVRNHPKVEKNNNLVLKIGTWNAKSLYAAGKTHNIINEMKRMNINILGVSEVRWPSSGQVNIGDHTMYYAGNAEPHHYNGVAIIVDKESNKSVKNFIPLSDRAALLQIKAYPRDINIIQVYAPTMEKPDTEIQQFYSDIKQLIKATKKNEVNIVMGDFNAKIGKGKVEDIVGNYGLGVRNDRGDLLLQFCQEENLMIANTWFQLPDRRLYTWKAPGDYNNNVIRNQIDYILLDKRYRNGIKGVKTYPGADIGSDHNPVTGKLEIKLKKIQHRRITRPNFRMLKEPEICEDVANTLNYKFQNETHIIAEDTVENTWKTMKNIIGQVQTEKLQHKNNNNMKKEWMTPEILQLMDTRRSYKNKNEAKYKETHTTITKLIRKAKEKWMDDRCTELKELQDKHDHFNIHKKIKEVTGPRNRTIPFKMLKTNNNEIISDQKDIEKEWVQYIQELFDDSRPEPSLTKQNEPPLNILVSEVTHAIKRSKTQKASGPDNIYVEMLQLLNEGNIILLTRLINKIYNLGTIPQDWLTSIFVPIPKKNNANKCSDFRLISLMSHALKIMLKVIHRRIYKKCEQNISDEQFGFRLGMGTREALFSLSVLLQKCWDQSQDVYLCFVDYEKAFDRIKHTELINILDKQGLDCKDITLIKNLYWEQSASIRLNNDNTTMSVPIMRGVRQGCILSPLLFNLYSETVFEKALENMQEGIKVNGRFINNLRYADDTVIIANSPDGLQKLIDAITTEGETLGLKINTEKTKTMVVSKRPNLQCNVSIYNKQIENVIKFKYLGSWITKDLDPEVEIRSRIEHARSAFLKMKNLLTNPTLSLDIRYRFVKTYIFSILLYGVETWTLGIRAMRRLEAFEMWVYRRLLKISWTEHISNETVLKRMGRDRKLLITIKKRKTSYLGHIYRGENYGFLRLIMEGKVEGRRGPGRRKCSWLKNVREWTGLDTHSLLRAAQDRRQFARIVADLQ